MWQLRGHDRLFSLALFWAALAPRLYAALRFAKEPVWDGHYYHFGAKRIAEGLGYSEDVIIGGVAHWKPWCHYPVGYSGFLGGLYKVFGSGLTVAPVANALVGALTAVLVHRIGRHWLTSNRSRLAGVLCAFHPGLVLYSAVVMTEGLAAFTVLLGGYLALAFRERWRGAVLTGVAFGASALVRPTALLMLPLLYFCWTGSWRKRLVMTCLAGAVTLLTVSPWTVRNCRVMDGCALISTNGGWNLAIGALTETGRFTTLRAEDGCRDVTGQVDQDKCWGRVGRQLILNDPWHWMTLIPKKLAQTYNHESFAVGYLAQARPELWPESRQNTWRSTLTVFHHLLMFGASLAAVSIVVPGPSMAKRGSWVQGALLFGAVVFYGYSLNTYDFPLYWALVVAPLIAILPLPGRPPISGAGYWLWGIVLLTSVTHAVFFGEDRYHLTISPMLCLLAAAALRPSALPGTQPAAIGDDASGPPTLSFFKGAPSA
jgi:4-amino-4-deoxy-L-arabinose transferase-like glycosyltransferase